MRLFNKVLYEYWPQVAERHLTMDNELQSAATKDVGVAFCGDLNSFFFFFLVLMSSVIKSCASIYCFLLILRLFPLLPLLLCINQRKSGNWRRLGQRMQCMFVVPILIIRIFISALYPMVSSLAHHTIWHHTTWHHTIL